MMSLVYAFMQNGQQRYGKVFAFSHFRMKRKERKRRKERKEIKEKIL